MDNDEKPFYAALGAAVGEARRAAGMSQADLGRLLGLTRQSIGNVEAGRQAVSAADLARLVDQIGLAVPWAAVASDRDSAAIAAENVQLRSQLREIQRILSCRRPRRPDDTEETRNDSR